MTNPSTPPRPSISPLPKHGTTARAKGRPAQGVRGCTCPPCHDALLRYDKRRRVLNATGRNLRIDARPAAQHVRNLLNGGMGWNGIVRAAGCSSSTLHRLLHGQETIQRTAADRILAITLQPLATRYTDATGSRRRIQALIAIGHTVATICEHTGIQQTTISDVCVGHHAMVRGYTHDRIARAYRQLASAPGTSRQSRERAVANGWHGPLAWDDIDNPDEQPDVDDGEKTSRHDALAEDGLWLERTQGYSRQQAAERLGVTRAALQKALDRARRAQTGYGEAA